MPLQVMHYEYPPVPELQPFVEAFWVSDATQQDYNACGFWPDPYADVIISCGAPLYVYTESGAMVALPCAFINGLHVKPRRLWAEGHVKVVAMRLYAWAVSLLLSSRTSQSVSGLMGLDATWQRIGQAVAKEVERHGYDAGVAVLHEFALRNFKQVEPYLDAQATSLQAVTRMLYASNGTARIADVANANYLSISKLEKRFKSLVGVPPKTFARLIRFWAGCEGLATNPARPSTELAYALGYTDQAHLYHEFNALGELTPREFSARVQANYTAWQPNEFLQYA